ncbi:MAG TPA: amidohydrolase family protein [Trebonia sp.]|jgi:aminocarboxymuconate-semialdehyde decarboxylase|nr:amidohydrolase family protein [Trebonia sp.]
MNGIDEPVIDIHAHALPAALLDEITAREIDGISAARADGGWRVSLPGSPAPRLVRPLMTDAGRRAAWTADRGLTAQVISPWLDAQPTAAMPDAAARDWARRLNAALIEQELEKPREQDSAAGGGSAAGSGNGHAVLATVALTGHAAGDLRQAVEEDGLAGLILSTNPAGVPDLADPALEALWETAAGLGVPVVLHPPTDGPARALPDSAEFGNTFCRLVDTTFAVTKLLLSGVLDRHPALRLVVVHGGGFLPYQSMRLDGGHRADALSGYRIERDRPSDYLQDLYFDTVALRPAAVGFLAGVAGAGQVLLGSDYPFPLGDPDPAGTVRAAGLPAADTAAVLGGNARRLFGALSSPTR